jgi:hypothetical protein
MKKYAGIVNIRKLNVTVILVDCAYTLSFGSLKRRRNVKIADIPPLDANVVNRVKIMIGGSLRRKRRKRSHALIVSTKGFRSTDILARTVKTMSSGILRRKRRSPWLIFAGSLYQKRRCTKLLNISKRKVTL